MSALDTIGDLYVERLLALQMLAVTDCKNAVGYPFHVQASWPYWTNRPGSIYPDRVQDHSDQPFEIQIVGRLVWGHIDAAFVGVTQSRMFTGSFGVMDYFTRHAMLADRNASDVTLQSPLRYLDPAGITVAAQELGFYNVNKVWVVATEFTFTARFRASYEELF